jgi:hypothetical protein
MGTSSSEQDVDDALEKSLQENQLQKAVQILRDNPNLEISRKRWSQIFDVIETSTAEADEQSINTRNEQAIPMLSKARKDMSDMYEILKEQGHLTLFGALSKDNLPAGGSKNVAPTLLEKITNLSMTSLTPKPSNTLLYAGIAVALLEGMASVAYGIDLNLLVLATIAAAMSDRILLNGALSESLVKVLAPETQPKITRHEAGHFLCAYLLGCPVEGYVLSAWAAMQDPRFGTRAVSAGTSFFDPVLTSQIESTKITRSSIDRYSIIVMAGIAAEAINYGRADGGAGDEMALIQFLLQLNGGSPTSVTTPWNELSIRNQARWGAMQAVLILREYKESYDALVDILERGGSLADCIYAIENAARKSGKGPLKEPLGYILDKGTDGDWVKELPEPKESVSVGVSTSPLVTSTTSATTTSSLSTTKLEPKSPEKSLEELREYKESVKSKIEEINKKLANLDSVSK